MLRRTMGVPAKKIERGTVEELCLLASDSVRDAIACINRNGKSIALVTNEKGQYIRTVTDGDIRRHILDGRSIEEPIERLLERTDARPFKTITATLETSKEDLIALMKSNGIRHIPILDAQGMIHDLVMLADLVPEQAPLRSLIVAGGYGKRLRPLTESMPKPMLPVGDRPLLQNTVEKLRESGIKEIKVSSHYLSEQIESHFGDGKDFGVHISYLTESAPLGTAGALGKLHNESTPLLVINGDILTEVDFQAMRAFHEENNAQMTVGVRKYEIKIPYGVLETDGIHVDSLKEKPELQFFINAGIYLIEPQVCKLIPKDTHVHMTDLIQILLDRGDQVVSFPIHEYWMDIGSHADYKKVSKLKK